MSLFDAAPTPSASRVSTPRGRPADEPPLSREAEPEAEPLATPADAAEYRAALAAFRTGAWPQERWTTFRLRHGVYAQAQADTYMVRAKLPGGRLSFDQARAVAVANRDHCGAAVHLTTRQDVQFYYLTLDGTADLLAALARGGVTTREASGNTFRNVTTCPLAGVCPHEHVDAAQVAERLATAWIRHPLTQHMPRKFKTTVSGCGHDCGMARIDDLGLIATVRDGRPGFRLLAGGGLGASPRRAVEIHPFVEEHDLPAVQEALARLHQGSSNRKRKMASRIKFLVDRFGEDGFRDRFRAAFERIRPLPRRPWAPLDWRRPSAVDPARPPLPGNRVAQHDGRHALVLRPHLGMVSSHELAVLADAAEGRGAAELRLTRDQNILVVGLPGRAVAGMVRDARALGIPVDEPPRGTGDLVACPGVSTCPIGVTNSNALARQILDRSAAFAGLPELRLRVSGCHNSCGQHHVGDIGLHGLSKKVDGRPVPYYRLHLGGEPFGSGRVGLEGPLVPARRAVDALKATVAAYAAERRDGEGVRAWAERQGAAGLEALLAPFTDVAAGADGLDRDWGADTSFVPAAAGAGECAAPVVVGEYMDDLARVRAADVARALAVGDGAEAARAAADAVLWVARRLWLVAGREPKPDLAADVLLGGVTDLYPGDANLAEALALARPLAAPGAPDEDRAQILAAWIAAGDRALEARLSGPTEEREAS